MYAHSVGSAASLRTAPTAGAPVQAPLALRPAVPTSGAAHARSVQLQHGWGMAAPRRDRCASTAPAARRRSSAVVDEGAEKDKLDPKAKAQLLAHVMETIRKRFGEGSLQHLDESSRVGAGVSTFSTGCSGLDMALGGGLPRGRVVEVFGPESCGKSTIALHAVAEVQKLGGNAAYIDVENALDPKYAAALGVNLSAKGFVVSQPDCGEQALEIMDELARSNAIDLIVVDSVAALVPRAELEGEIGMASIGLQARLMSSSLRKLAGSAAKSGTCLLFINQIRNKVGVLYGSPEVTAGGNALKYYASVRIDLRKKEVLTNGTNATGIKVRAKVVKNKVAAPHREAMFDIVFGRGIDNDASLLDGAEAAGVVARRGSYYYFKDAKMGQGRDKALEWLRTETEKRAEIDAALKDFMSSNPSGLAASADADDADDPLFADDAAALPDV